MADKGRSSIPFSTHVSAKACLHAAGWAPHAAATASPGIEPRPPSMPLPRSALLQARGVPLFDRGRFFDLPRHVARMLLDLRDISSSFV